MKVLVFTEGTIIMHRGAAGLTRDEILEQLKKNEPTVHNYGSYIPVGNSAGKLNSWAKQGAEIVYVTSRRNHAEIRDIQSVLNKYGFPQGRLIYRHRNEAYKDIAEAVAPDVLVEDNCESIGGAEQMTITHVKESIKHRIKSIVIKEFGGIDYLPDDITSL